LQIQIVEETAKEVIGFIYFLQQTDRHFFRNIILKFFVPPHSIVAIFRHVFGDGKTVKQSRYRPAVALRVPGI